MDGVGITFELAVAAAITAWQAAGYPQDSDTYLVTAVHVVAPGGVVSIRVHLERGE